jgi:CarboxypepD_reg-like domain
MLRLIVFLCCCLLTWSFVPVHSHGGSQAGNYSSDHKLTGSLLDAKTSVPLSYVSIGFPGHPAGTMTDAQGKFTLSVREEYLDRQLRFSVVDYQAKEVPVRQLLEEQAAKGHLQIQLEAKPRALAEVQVKARNKRFLTQQAGSQIGKLTPFRHSFDNYTFPGDKARGPELGVKIRARKYPAYLQNVSFCLSGTGADVTRVRLKFYSLRNDLPYKEIAQDRIVVDVPPKYTGWIETDISRYHLVLEQDFVVALEWLKDENETQKTWLASGMVFSPRTPDYYKAAGQNQWKMLLHESVGLYVTLLYQK